MVSLNKITIHWTGGIHFPNMKEFNAYHYLVDRDCRVHEGFFKPEDNLDCKDGKYAAHCGGGNTGNIGVAMCGMFGYKSPVNCGEFLITKYQFEKTMKLVAELCFKYGILVTPATVFTHKEFNETHPNASKKVKCDIEYIAPYPWVKEEECGAFIRSKIKWYLERLQSGEDYPEILPMYKTTIIKENK